MFAGFSFGQGYFGQGAPGIVQAIVSTLVALDLVGTVGLPVDAYAAALAIALDTTAFYAPTLDLSATVGET